MFLSIKNVPKVIEIVNKYNEESNFQVLILGEASIASASNELSEEDLIRGESIGGSVALVILILVFGGLVAGILPVVLAILSIVIATGLVAIIGNIYQLSFFITNMVTMIGLAVGIDYTLFIISRYREERNQDFDKYEAVRRTASTATRSVVISGITVMLALLGNVLFVQWKTQCFIIRLCAYVVRRTSCFRMLCCELVRHILW